MNIVSPPWITACLQQRKLVDEKLYGLKESTAESQKDGLEPKSEQPATPVPGVVEAPSTTEKEEGPPTDEGAKVGEGGVESNQDIKQTDEKKEEEGAEKEAEANNNSKSEPEGAQQEKQDEEANEKEEKTEEVPAKRRILRKAVRRKSKAKKEEAAVLSDDEDASVAVVGEAKTANDQAQISGAGEPVGNIPIVEEEKNGEGDVVKESSEKAAVECGGDSRQEGEKKETQEALVVEEVREGGGRVQRDMDSIELLLAGLHPEKKRVSYGDTSVFDFDGEDSAAMRSESQSEAEQGPVLPTGENQGEAEAEGQQVDATPIKATPKWMGKKIKSTPAKKSTGPPRRRKKKESEQEKENENDESPATNDSDRPLIGKGSGRRGGPGRGNVWVDVDGKRVVKRKIDSPEGQPATGKKKQTTPKRRKQKKENEEEEEDDEDEEEKGKGARRIRPAKRKRFRETDEEALRRGVKLKKFRAVEDEGEKEEIEDFEESLEKDGKSKDGGRKSYSLEKDGVVMVGQGDDPAGVDSFIVQLREKKMTGDGEDEAFKVPCTQPVVKKAKKGGRSKKSKSNVVESEIGGPSLTQMKQDEQQKKKKKEREKSSSSTQVPRVVVVEPEGEEDEVLIVPGPSMPVEAQKKRFNRPDELLKGCIFAVSEMPDWIEELLVDEVNFVFIFHSQLNLIRRQ